MRPVKLLLSAAVVVFLALCWQAQRETNRRLDALAAAVAAKPEAPPPAPLPEAVADPAVVPAAGRVPRELNHVTPLPPYVVEAPDVLTIEVQTRDPGTGGLKPVPEVGGQHLVRPDGTIGLGPWGSVPVAGLTVDRVAEAVRKVAAPRVTGEPVVAVDVVAYNSKVYYVITDGDAGEQMFRLACTGNETVLDAMAQLRGLAAADGKSLWLARPAPAGGGHQVLPVDWAGITQRGETATNYQLLPGDRLYVKAGK